MSGHYEVHLRAITAESAEFMSPCVGTVVSHPS